MCLLVIDAYAIFAVYHDCDLVRGKKISRNDQVMSFGPVPTFGENGLQCAHQQQVKCGSV